jgi:hypothetical protein
MLGGIGGRLGVPVAVRDKVDWAASGSVCVTVTLVDEISVKISEAAVMKLNWDGIESVAVCDTLKLSPPKVVRVPENESVVVVGKSPDTERESTVVELEPSVSENEEPPSVVDVGPESEKVDVGPESEKVDVGPESEKVDVGPLSVTDCDGRPIVMHNNPQSVVVCESVDCESVDCESVDCESVICESLAVWVVVVPSPRSGIVIERGGILRVKRPPGSVEEDVSVGLELCESVVVVGGKGGNKGGSESERKGGGSVVVVVVDELDESVEEVGGSVVVVESVVVVLDVVLVLDGLVLVELLELPLSVGVIEMASP